MLNSTTENTGMYCMANLLKINWAASCIKHLNILITRFIITPFWIKPSEQMDPKNVQIIQINGHFSTSYRSM